MSKRKEITISLTKSLNLTGILQRYIDFSPYLLSFSAHNPSKVQLTKEKVIEFYEYHLAIMEDVTSDLAQNIGKDVTLHFMDVI